MNARSCLLTLILASLAVPTLVQTAPAETSPKPMASVEARWDGVYCDLLSVSRPNPGELTIRYRYRNLSNESLRFPTLKDFVPQTVLLEPLEPAVYGPFKDVDGKTVGSSTLGPHGGGKTIAAGASQAHWVKLVAPPEAVTSVTPIVQGCAPFEEVPVGGSSPGVDPRTVPLPAAVSQDMEVEGMAVEVVEIRRVPGSLLHLAFRYRNNGSEPYKFPNLQNKAAETYIVDSANRTKYEVVFYEKYSALASTTQDLATGSGTTIQPGKVLDMWARFPAPPEETTRIGLFVPEAQPFEGLEIAGTGTGSTEAGSPVAGSATVLDAALKDLGAEVTDTDVRIEMGADVLFAFDEAELKDEAAAALEPVLTVLASYPEAQVTIEGHTDSKGDEAYNQTLSEKRAESVKGWLVGNANFNAARIRTTGLGETKPVAHNTKPDGSDDPEGRQKNRRVTIVVQK